MELVYSIFLLLSAWYDLRTAKIPIWLLVLFGITGALGLLTGAWQEYSGVLAAFLPGIFLLLVTICTGGAAGAGDGCFFIVSACYLGSYGTIVLFLCGLFSVGRAVWGWQHGDLFMVLMQEKCACRFYHSLYRPGSGCCS